MRVWYRLTRGFVPAVFVGLVVVLTPSQATAGSCLLPPVDTPITRPFEAPTCPYCAGHRGLTYQPGEGSAVRSVSAGTVTFSGPVAGVRYVVVSHSDGLLATYGYLRSSDLSAGQVVAAGAIIGLAGEQLHFGLRDGPESYLDPAPHLGAWFTPPYLVPSDGSAGRAPPPPILRCPD